MSIPPFGGVDDGTPSNSALQRQLLYAEYSESSLVINHVNRRKILGSTE